MALFFQYKVHIGLIVLFTTVDFRGLESLLAFALLDFASDFMEILAIDFTFLHGRNEAGFVDAVADRVISCDGSKIDFES